MAIEDGAGTGEVSLDPEDWSSLRALGHRMLDDMFDHLAGQREQPVWREVPAAVREALDEPLPWQGQPIDAVYDDFRRLVLPYPMGNPHPRFWGWVMGNGTAVGMLADMLASGFNPNMGGGDHAGTLVEQQVIAWWKALLGFPPAASGLLVSGGSMANLVGLTVARNARSDADIRQGGVAAAPRPPTVYASAEVHSSVQKAVELLGLGARSLRLVPTDARYRVDVAALRRTLDDDLAAGRRPICLVGCAGTINTGAVDPLEALAEVAAEYGLWFHVDGAFGALAYLSPRLRGRLAGLERADSVAFDLHKWGYLPFEVGCVLVRSEELHRRAFSLTPDYLTHAERGLAAGESWFSDYGVQLSRGFRALKVWMSLKAHGATLLGQLVEQNVAQAHYLEDAIERTPALELLAPRELNIVCFRYVDPALDEAALDPLNKELLLRLQESGKAIVSGTTVGGRYALRCCITNHRTRREDLDLLREVVLQLGDALVRERAHR